LFFGEEDFHAGGRGKDEFRSAGGHECQISLNWESGEEYVGPSPLILRKVFIRSHISPDFNCRVLILKGQIVIMSRGLFCDPYT
jgi:hypothetical protein